MPMQGSMDQPSVGTASAADSDTSTPLSSHAEANTSTTTTAASVPKSSATSSTPSSGSDPKQLVFGLPILDGRHTPQNVCLYAYALGIIAGFGVLFSFISATPYSGIHICGSIAVSMGIEYILSALLGEAQDLSAFALPRPYQTSLLLLVAFLEGAVGRLLFGSQQSSLCIMLTYVGYLCLFLAQMVYIIARVGPLMKYTLPRSIILNSKLVFPYWNNACASALFWWIISAQISQCSIIGLFLTVYMRDILKSSDTDVYVWPEVVDDDHPIRRGVLGLKLFDYQHTRQNIAAYAFSLGVVAGCGFAIALLSHGLRGLGFFLVGLPLFHTLEYVNTVSFHSDAALKSFLINHSFGYHMAITCGVIEFLIGWAFFPSFKQFSWINAIGLLMVLASQYLRAVAMITAGTNFTHIISENKQSAHQLVTTGIYSFFRHPSYTGFYYWSLGQQVMLANPICFCVYLVVLHGFFSDRIEFEEKMLAVFFGSEYIAYKAKSYTLIPGIK
ncbi:hypothetical protein BASA50_000648 [Batrachochytrium salamandrivorans]|uniref:Protein-S-isoprenylcysteine O-methyltransferase n=1 Tax=Batrachochytrium salamandrivorans TaxID=1357716 RepID=A0ABQ8EW88_9FUNG|nr:hypothetical protein BASA60_007131 [Batrachochytrium salamandrivorans]KAH6576140.1 hypothetical protein BASA62_001579 [Batrachochytrium salamandrivorans]KAH6579597.1 hypothetical protein BASA61_010113 [Batrachochytrium salamandrivorans]KAH6586183.1 hypothetical protein BASA50_000648 [Batrachochytrium salamandrivorans]KAH9265597.1 hypothetical protein BASA84_001525 [Batrachochytrium salamandrivorans]